MGYKLNYQQGTGNSPKLTLRLPEELMKKIDKQKKFFDTRSDFVRYILTLYTSLDKTIEKIDKFFYRDSCELSKPDLFKKVLELGIKEYEKNEK